ncbi:NAD(P)-binding protein [Lepidopterella palustris CBS 459.81]|uniref:NAD(P)-binding protein n=1 Tax=Lepidopterella palustris CBS 459.81 TaxID=1314670 RepID=A0A8E2EKN7_9PEZI|nr:NAD(P)-binding protein [Lepidopterella palustris CBS 459.81]
MAEDKRKTVLITGCSPGGIGHALAREFNSKGFHVLATARSASTISDLVPLGITTLSLTVDEPASVSACLSQVTQITHGSLDILVNNAGRNYTVPALDIDFAEVQQTFDVNVFAVMRICQAFAPLLVAAKGTIVQIGSLAGVMPYVFGSVYNASKAALHAYSNTLRVELAPFGVHVITIVTGGVKSNIARTERHLPANSIYLPIDAEYQRRLKHSQEGGMDNEAYARSVVTKVLSGRNPRWVWQGNMSWVIWFVQRFLPMGVMDHVFTRMFNLWKLRNPSGTKESI